MRSINQLLISLLSANYDAVTFFSHIINERIDIRKIDQERTNEVKNNQMEELTNKTSKLTNERKNERTNDRSTDGPTDRMDK